ncbi:MAG: TetR/AcrR family transcriptional regulator [Pseudomonadota bacterium]
MPRRTPTEQETRDLILDRAYGLFADIGYNKTTIGDIAKACGFSSANVHKHFGTKSAINQAIASVMLEEKLKEGRAAVARHRSASKKFTALIKTVHESTLKSFKHRVKVYDTLAAAAEEKWEAIRAYRLELMAMVRDIVSLGCETGEFSVKDVDRATQAIHMALTRVIHPANIVEMIDEPDAGDIDTLTEFLLAGLGKK